MSRLTRVFAAAMSILLVVPLAASGDIVRFSNGTLQDQNDLFFDVNLGAIGELDVGTSVPSGPMIDHSGNYYIFNGTVTWTESPLVLDRPQPNGKAIGDFGGGGVFSAVGTLSDSMYSPIFTGTLISGTVPAFTLEETVNPDSNQLASEFLIYLDNPTGGLVDGIPWTDYFGYSHTLTILNPAIRPQWAEVSTSPGGLPLTDFTTSLAAGAGSQIFLLGELPEPASVLLVSLAAVSLWPARRRKARS